jgi:hypothetical protein
LKNTPRKEDFEERNQISVHDEYFKANTTIGGNNKNSVGNETFDSIEGPRLDYPSGIMHVHGDTYDGTHSLNMIQGLENKNSFTYIEHKAKEQKNNLESDLQEIKEVYSNFKHNVENSIKRSSNNKSPNNV